MRPDLDAVRADMQSMRRRVFGDAVGELGERCGRLGRRAPVQVQTGAVRFHSRARMLVGDRLGLSYPGFTQPRALGIGR